MKMRIIGGLGIAAALAVTAVCTPGPFALSGFDTPARAAATEQAKPRVIVASFTQPAPSLRPSILDGSTNVAEAEPVAAASASQAQIQLGAYRDEANAATDWNHVRAQTGDLLSGLAPEVVPVDVPDKGRLYRLRVGLADRAAADALCEGLKSRGVDCFSVKD